MIKLLLALTVATVAFLGFASESEAGGCGYRPSYSYSGYHGNSGYYHHRGYDSYRPRYYRPRTPRYYYRSYSPRYYRCR